MATYATFSGLDTPIGSAGDSGFFRLNARLRPDQLQPGEIAVSDNGRMGLDGAWQPRKGANLFSSALTTSTEVLTVPFYTYGNVTVASGDITVGAGEVSFAITGHSFVDSTLAYVSTISGVTGLTAGNYVVTVVDVDNIKITVAGVGGAAAGSATVGAPIVDDDAVNGIYGQCLFSDPSDDNAEYILIATNSSVQAIPVDGSAATTIDYPAGVSVASFVDMIQAFNKVFIFRDGLTALEWDGDLSGSPAFTLVANGAYAQPTVYTSANNAVASGGVVTVTETGHTLNIGDTIKIYDAGTTDLEVGQFYEIHAADSVLNTFSFYADVDDFSATSIVVGKPQSVGVGFTHMPAPPWGIYHQRRLWVPYNYTTSGSSGSPTIASRDVRDEVIASDVFDSDTYDHLQNQFKIASGGADYIVAIQPFSEDNILIFCRNSIHLISGVSGGLEDTVVKEVTREVGCVARKSVVQVGNQVFFLSDNGIYSVDFGDLYNLRGASIPLSEAIQPYIDRINQTAAPSATAVYHDNRYYLAVPLDAATENDTIFVYNFINQGWESIDSVGDAGWNVRGFVRAGAGGLNRLFAVNSIGGVHELEKRLDDVDFIATQTGSSGSAVRIPAVFTSRAYNLGTIEKKRWNSFEVQTESTDTNQSDAEFILITENPDSESTLSSLSTLNGGVLDISEDASLEGRCGNKRGYSAQLQITPTQGRPKIRTISLSAQLTDYATSSKT